MPLRYLLHKLLLVCVNDMLQILSKFQLSNRRRLSVYPSSNFLDGALEVELGPNHVP